MRLILRHPQGKTTKHVLIAAVNFLTKTDHAQPRTKHAQNVVKKNHFANNVEAVIETHEGAKNRMTCSRKELRPMRKSDDESSSNSDSESTEYCYAVNNKQKHPRTYVSINGQRVKMTIDTGSSIYKRDS